MLRPKVEDMPPPLAGNTPMSPNTRNISHDHIIREIIKALLLANKNKKNIIVEIISKLNIKSFLDISYRSIDFTSENLCRCILFMKLKGLNQSELEKYLKTHKNERKKLRLKRTPDQTMISFFIRKKLDEESKNIIKITTKTIEKYAGKKGITLDSIKIKRNTKKKNSRKSNLSYKKNRMTRQISKIFKKRILPFINFRLKQNCVYTEKNLTSLILHIAKENDFSENGSSTLREDLKQRRLMCPKCNQLLFPKSEVSNEDINENLFICLGCGYEKRISPLGATFRYHLKKTQSPAEILNMFIRTFEALWEMIPDTKAFKNTPVTVAIDTTEWLYFGKKDNQYICGKKPERGAKYCYRFITLDIVQPGKRYTLLALPYTQLDNQRELLNKLLEFTRRRIKIRLAVLDRGFFNIEALKLFNKYRIKYITPCTRYHDIKKVLKAVPAPYIINNCKMGNEVTYNMAIIKEINKRNKKEEIHAFATNIPLNEEHIKEDAVRISKEYRARWGIETGYRIKKQSFLPKTTSKDYRIRLFYFFFSILLYNMWILTDVFIWIEIKGRVGFDHKVTANFFRMVFFLIDPGG
jgi:putative transposase